MNSCTFIIKSMGRYLPKKPIYASDIDTLCDLSSGYTLNRSKVKKRYWASTDESTLYMAQKACDEALDKAQLTIDDIDCVISAGCLVPQIVPSTASLLLARYDTKKQDCFDIDCTCLSVVKALSIATTLLQTNQYKNILLFSSEMASCGIHKDNFDAYSLFGDGAIAMVLSKAENKMKLACDDNVVGIDNAIGNNKIYNQFPVSTIRTSLFQAFPDGGALSQCRGCGTINHPKVNPIEDKTSLFFEMNGPKLFKIAARELPSFVDCVLDKAQLNKSEIDFVIPHQSSYQSLVLVQRLLGFKKDKFINQIEDYGNQVSVSIPNALYDLINSGKLKRGNKVLLLGAAAGVVLGGLVFEY